MPRIFIYGYGNPGRKDDGLGILFADELEKSAAELGWKDIDFDVNYQLNPEDAIAIAPYDVVLFADASAENIREFTVEKVNAEERAEYTSHSVSPGHVTFLCHSIFETHPAVYLLHIRGYEWQLEEGVSEKAKLNLKKALDFAKSFIENLIAHDVSLSTA